MSTVGHLKQSARSWSEENLFQVQTKEEIARLKVQIKELKKLEDVVKGKDVKLEAQEAQIMKMRVQIYDLTKNSEKLAKKVHKKAIKSKKQQVNKKAAAEQKRIKKTGAVLDTMSKVQKKQSQLHDAQIDTALAFLATEEKTAADAAPAADNDDTDDIDDTDDTATVAAVPDDEASVAGGSEDGSSVQAYEFDLRALADAQPTILLETALDAQDNFIAADANGNGLLSYDELKHVLPGQLLGVLSPNSTPAPGAASDADPIKTLIKEASFACEISETEQEFDFLDCVQIILKLKEWACQEAASPVPDPASPGVAVGSIPHRHANVADVTAKKRSGQRNKGGSSNTLEPPKAKGKARKSDVSQACLVM